MFREMRRKKQALSIKECELILQRGTSGVLALSGDEGYPYSVPISYVFSEGTLYFHCAKQGHKIDAIKRSPKASFCVIDQDYVVAEEYTSYFRSVIVFGKIRIMEKEEEKRMAIEKLALKYAPADTVENRKKAIDKEWAPLCMLEMATEHISGKEAIELVNKREEP